MNPKQFTDTLHHILEKDIPDDMDKLNVIRDAIAERNMIRSRRTQALSRIAAIIIVTLLLLVGSVVAYAVYQALVDPGLESAIEQGLVQEINQSQTIDGVTVTVKQAYADTTRIAIWYTIEGLDIPKRAPMELLMDRILYMPGGTDWFSMGGQSGNYDEETDTYLATFNHAEPRPADGIYQLEFHLNFGGPGRFAVVVPEGVELPQGEIPDAYKVTLPEIGPFIFELALKASEPVLLEPETTVTSNGLAMTLKQVEIAPSQTKIQLCFDLPDGGDWQPKVSLLLDDQEGLLSGYSLIGLPDPSQTNRCVRMEFLLAYTGEEQQMNIHVNGLKTSAPEASPDVLDRAKERLAEQGIVVEFNLGSHGFGYDVIEKPEDMSESDVGMAVFDAMAKHYDADWQFSLDLP